ncbi:glycoside hydrolase family 16 protein [Bacillus sp. REN10]|uniref:glycoside hydrolase family 16 protein n=1 Tax=Bacillus sp. REN10 TaxID=2782541 RepID=UPI00193C2938|nr:glycoside hydrolase family 16 protein [Bacillus sp. REN10]
MKFKLFLLMSILLLAFIVINFPWFQHALLVHPWNRTVERFDTFNDKRWEIRKEFPLGQGYLLANQVSHQRGKIILSLSDQEGNGGEIRTRETFQYGRFEADIQVADAPGSITGFFLYAPPDLYHEIDIEIWNDSSGKVLFTIYKDGKEAKQATYQLPFDPTKSVHRYRMDILPDEVSFYIDGEQIQAWEGQFSSKDMQLMINSWYPTWLTKQKANKRETVIEQVQY